MNASNNNTKWWIKLNNSKNDTTSFFYLHLFKKPTTKNQHHIPQPTQVFDVRQFLQQARNKDAKLIKIKKANAATKFKLRFATQLYTLVIKDKKQASKIRKSLPSALKVVDVSTNQRKEKK